MANIDAVDIGAGLERAPDHGAVRGRMAERCKGLYAAAGRLMACFQARRLVAGQTRPEGYRPAN
jgi:hypothetical protein